MRTSALTHPLAGGALAARVQLGSSICAQKRPKPQTYNTRFSRSIWTREECVTESVADRVLPKVLHGRIAHDFGPFRRIPSLYPSWRWRERIHSAPPSASADSVESAFSERLAVAESIRRTPSESSASGKFLPTLDLVPDDTPDDAESKSSAGSASKFSSRVMVQWLPADGIHGSLFLRQRMSGNVAASAMKTN